jgi:hypothetical protein
MQPSRKRGITTKGRDLAIELEKRLLRKVLSCPYIASYAETDRVNSPFVKIVERFEAFSVALLGSVDGFGF